LSTNTLATFELTVHTMNVTTGKVDKENPLEPGKFAVVIKKERLKSSRIMLKLFNSGLLDVCPHQHT
ncbi:hypothetical protein MJO29_010083, partial [Puccinia striiformis f. sp. tritici]